jgi:hypothetical protein
LVCIKQVDQSFRTQLLFVFDLFEGFLDERKTMDYNQNFMLFLNIDSKIVWLFLFERSRGISASHKNRLKWQANRLFKTCIIPFRKVPKIVRVNDFVEQTLLHKMLSVLSYQRLRSFYVKHDSLKILKFLE